MSLKPKLEVKAALEAAGGLTAFSRQLAAELDITPERALYRVQRWVYNGIPAKYVITAEKISGVSRQVIAPDIYPD